MKKYVLLVVFLVNFILIESGDRWGVNDQVELIMDMSTSCIDDLQTDIYLPYEMGASDAAVIIISDNDLYPNCILKFYTLGGNHGVYIIIVIEFPDRTEGEKNACQEEGSTILIKEAARSDIDVCDEVNKLKFGYSATATYSLFSNATNVSVVIESKSLFETVKITATSARKLNQYQKCNPEKEVPCAIANASVCVSKELLCDDNINCGTVGLNDEDVRICDESRYKRLWLVVVSGIVMVMIIVFFLIHLLKTCLPAVPDSFFIFNEDEDNKLILSTKFVAPQRLPPTSSQLPTDASSFRFRSVPVTTTFSKDDANMSISRVLKPPAEEIEELISDLYSNLTESELQTLNYKDEIRKEMEEMIERLPLKASTLGDEKPSKSPKIAKKPRFEEDSISEILTHTSLFKEHEESKSKRKAESKEASISRRGSIRRVVDAMAGLRAGTKRGSMEVEVDLKEDVKQDGMELARAQKGNAKRDSLDLERSRRRTFVKKNDDTESHLERGRKGSIEVGISYTGSIQKDSGKTVGIGHTVSSKEGSIDVTQTLKERREHSPSSRQSPRRRSYDV